MPIYEYKASTEQHCPFCGPGFEKLRKSDDPELQHCPECNAPVHRLVSAPNLASGPSLNTSNIEKHGFTQYKKSSKGVYEKTAGKGPAVISDKEL